jgi:hypothetical protein
MAVDAPDIRNDIDAGFYLRAKRQIRSWSCSWSWGKKKLTNVSEAEMEGRWAGVAEWLRVAHSLLDDKTMELPRNADR